MTYSVANREQHGLTAPITPNGTCQPKHMLFCRGTMDQGATNTQVANTYILGLMIIYPINAITD